MVKPPNGREKPWHQDHAYFNIPLVEPVVGVWIALGEATRRNGCMVLAPYQRVQRRSSSSSSSGPAAANTHPPRRPVVHFMRRDWQICDDDILGNRAAGAGAAAGSDEGCQGECRRGGDSVPGPRSGGDGGVAVAYTRVAVPMAEGDVLLFDSLLPHGTDTNRTSEHRWALQYHFCRSEADLQGGGAGAPSAKRADQARLAIFGSDGKDVTC